MRTSVAPRAVTATALQRQADFRRRAIMAAAVVLLAGGALFTIASQAQQVFRIVGPDGKVTFSDKPPVVSTGRVSAADAGAVGTAGATGLPFELRQVAGKYPVTLYTGDNCAPCGAARAMLTSRGVPFSEKIVKTPEDIQALQRLSNDSILPFGTIGSQQLKGFSDSEWTQFLTAAGYPATSVLPASYRAPAPTPMVAVAPPAAAGTGTANGSAPGAATTRTPPPTPVSVQPSNPAGIKF